VLFNAHKANKSIFNSDLNKMAPQKVLFGADRRLSTVMPGEEALRD
jgi:hypothetical protein